MERARTLKLKIALSCWGKEPVGRIIEVPENKTLHRLHTAIQRAFGWYNDHLYSFFMSNQRWDRSSEYTSPVDIDESHAKSAAIAKLKDFYFEPKQKFLYIMILEIIWITR